MFIPKNVCLFLIAIDAYVVFYKSCPFFVLNPQICISMPKTGPKSKNFAFLGPQ